MKTIAISGSLRGNVGKRESKELRYKGKAPAVLYGGENQLHFSVIVKDLTNLIYSPDVHFVDLKVAETQYKAIVQDVQFHPLTGVILHIDFLELKEDKTTIMEIPILFTGASPGVKLGGKLIQKLRKLRVKALPKDLPQYMEISLEALEIGKSIRVRDLKFTNLIITNNSDDTIVSVTMSRALKQAEQESAKSSK